MADVHPGQGKQNNKSKRKVKRTGKTTSGQSAPEAKQEVIQNVIEEVSSSPVENGVHHYNDPDASSSTDAAASTDNSVSENGADAHETNEPSTVGTLIYGGSWVEVFHLAAATPTTILGFDWTFNSVVHCIARILMASSWCKNLPDGGPECMHLPQVEK